MNAAAIGSLPDRWALIRSRAALRAAAVFVFVSLPPPLTKSCSKSKLTAHDLISSRRKPVLRQSYIAFDRGRSMYLRLKTGEKICVPPRSWSLFAFTRTLYLQVVQRVSGQPPIQEGPFQTAYRPAGGGVYRRTRAGLHNSSFCSSCFSVHCVLQVPQHYTLALYVIQ